MFEKCIVEKLPVADQEHDSSRLHRWTLGSGLVLRCSSLSNEHFHVVRRRQGKRAVCSKVTCDFFPKKGNPGIWGQAVAPPPTTCPVIGCGRSVPQGELEAHVNTTLVVHLKPGRAGSPRHPTAGGPGGPHPLPTPSSWRGLGGS